LSILTGVLLVAVSSYLIGSIPSSYVMGKLLKGIDLREHGSGNLGAANTFRILGAKAAVPVLLFDVGKGFIAVKYFSDFGGDAFYFPLVAAFFVVFGHNYSVFVRFSGGKGVGATTGAFIALAPFAVLLSFILWVAVLLFSRIVSLASMIAAAFLPFAILISNRLLGADTHISITVLATVVAIVVIYKHKSNIRRLREGTEKRIF